MDKLPCTGKACFASQSELCSPSSCTNLMPKACMDNLPTELVQYIFDQLDYNDQLHMKCVNLGFYYCINIKPIPYIFVFEPIESFGNNSTYDWINPIDCRRLDECRPDNYMGHKYGGADYAACILNQNKSKHNPPNISDFCYFNENCELMYKFGEGDYGVCIVNNNKYNHNKTPNVSDFKYFDFDNNINNKTENGEYYVHSTFMFCYSGHEHNITYVEYEDGTVGIFNQTEFVQKCINSMNRRK